VEPIHPYIIPEKWLEYNGTIIAFTFQNMNYYFDATARKIAMKIQNAPVIKLKYHPNKINKIIMESQSQSQSADVDVDDRVDAEALYSYYEYQLFVLAFLDYVSHTYRNPIRKRIMSLMLKSKQSDIQKKINTVDSMLLADIVLSGMVNRFISHGDRKAMINEFNEKRFIFDTPSLEELVKLAENVKEYTTVSDSPIKSFPRIISDCSDSNSYCKNKKLIVRKGRLPVLLEVLISDLRSPFKGPALLSGLNDRTLSFFDFYKRSFEIINIEFRSFYKN
jgi:hypothetical protein